MKPIGRGNWKPREWTISGVGQMLVAVGMRFEMGGITWRVCEVRP